MAPRKSAPLTDLPPKRELDRGILGIRGLHFGNWESEWRRRRALSICTEIVDAPFLVTVAQIGSSRRIG